MASLRRSCPRERRINRKGVAGRPLRSEEVNMFKWKVDDPIQATRSSALEGNFRSQTGGKGIRRKSLTGRRRGRSGAKAMQPRGGEA